MSTRERGRLVVMERVREGKMKLIEASKVLDLGYRQTRRVYGRYEREGDKGLIHHSRGQRSHRGQAQGGEGRSTGGVQGALLGLWTNPGLREANGARGIPGGP